MGRKVDCYCTVKTDLVLALLSSIRVKSPMVTQLSVFSLEKLEDKEYSFISGVRFTLSNLSNSNSHTIASNETALAWNPFAYSKFVYATQLKGVFFL